MGDKYYRALINIESSDSLAAFVRVGERVVVDTNFDSGDNGAVYSNVKGGLCWLAFKDVRDETSQEAIEELLLGNW